MNPSDYNVRAVRCDHTATDEQVYEALKRATDPLTRAWDRLANAGTIALKFNQDYLPERVIYRHGQRQQLVSDQITRATLRLLRERTGAKLIAVDVGVDHRGKESCPECTTIQPLLDEFGVEFVDGLVSPVAWAEVPGGGSLFGKYPVQAASVEADEIISVQKIKNHKFAGITLSMKNLFGLTALAPGGRPRSYYHHLVRLPYVLADLGRIYDPALNILDGMVCQASEEWGPGDYPVDAGVIIAGDHTTATDAFCTHLMGHDPTADWRTPPFHRDRNHLLIAANAGFGTVDLAQINAESEVEAPLGSFFTREYDGQERILSWIRTTAEQGLFYRDHREQLFMKHAGEYILLQMGEVRWHDSSGHLGHSRRVLAGDHLDEALWLKFVDPEEDENEKFDVYERTLEML